MVSLEVIATTLEDVKTAGDYGADRIELTVGLTEGALTPSLGMLEQATHIASVPMVVMIRPRDGACTYSEAEMEAMRRDAALVAELGLDGIVCGMLTSYGAVDMKNLQGMLEACRPLSMVFHRGFDQVSDPFEALDILAKQGSRIPRVLTSGLQALTVDGIPMIRQLIERAQGRISIMPGTGITLENMELIITKTEVQDIHLGIGLRTPATPAGRLDGEKVEKAKRIIEAFR
jgi:copper homeostasis protein